ncbi:hypothetical protein ACR79K_27175 [Sphingobacterium siyangense]|uniref:hypothetical protein n=1 Tax=Sphingobacterium siyangense TaxID=459529 RepID=UPI003DA2FD6A
MQLNIDFNIKSTYDIDTNNNSVTVSIDSNKSLSDHFTALELAKQGLINAIEAYVKTMPDGMLTEKEMEDLVNTPLKKLKGFEV